MNTRLFYALYLIAALAVIGLIMMLTSLWVPAKAAVAQILLEDSWSHYQLTGEHKKPWPWADHHAVARLLAPRQNISQVVLSGDTGRSLAFAPGLTEGINSDAAKVISAHRDTHFRFLEDVAINDTLILEQGKGATQYTILATEIVDATKVKVDPSVIPNGLILVTCYPFDAPTAGGPLRYLVFAEKTTPTIQQYVM